jgi:hypothetical protein
MSVVSFVCLSGRGLCDGLITRPEEIYRLWCVLVCDLETSRLRRLKIRKWVVKATRIIIIIIIIYIYIYAHVKESVEGIQFWMCEHLTKVLQEVSCCLFCFGLNAPHLRASIKRHTVPAFSFSSHGLQFNINNNWSSTSTTYSQRHAGLILLW